MRPRKLILLVLGVLLALPGFALVAGSGVLLWLYGTQREADDFVTSPAYDLTSRGVAVVSEDIGLGADPGDWFPADLDVRVTATPIDLDDTLFVGLAPTDDLTRYLGGASHDRVTRLGVDADDVATEQLPGGDEVTPPTATDIWVASDSGQGTLTLDWEATSGSWSVAVLNADGSAGVAATVTGGVEAGLMLPIGIGVLLGGLVLLGLAAGLVLVAVASPSGAVAADGGVPSTGPVAIGPYPIAIRGRLDPDLSRWQWLVKWLLALPHLIVLALLVPVFIVLTIAAGFAILFTGRYPRSIFDTNVGIMRWGWRVSYYAFGVLGTDRYPPFSLAPADDYPADLTVVYPTELSRGLVLVKWWLLALPHLLIVGVLTGSLVSWTTDIGDPGDWQVVFGGGLIGILVLVAAIALLVTGRYPRGLFDLVLGLQRWVWRVTAYVALMTDEYPPFRLDGGGEEPVVTPPTGPGGGTGGTPDRPPVPSGAGR